MEDSTGMVLANGTIKFTPMNTAGVPISFRAGGVSGQAIAEPVSALVTDGAFEIDLADTTLTDPSNVCYSVSIINNVSGQQVPFPGYGCIQASGSTWDLDSYIPLTPGNALVVAGPTGATGQTEPAGSPCTSGGTCTASSLDASLNTVINAAAPPYSAVCNGTTDVTAALNAAIVAAEAGDYLLQLPQGVCLITAPLLFTTAAGVFPMVEGAGTGTELLANYANWHGTDYAAVEVAVPASIANQEAGSERHFGNLLIVGENNSTLPSTIGFEIHNTAASVSAEGLEANYAPWQAWIHDMYVEQFDTCYQVNDLVQSNLDRISGSYCRVGLLGQGFLVGDSIHEAKFNFPSLAYTSSTGTTIGVQLAGKFYNCPTCGGGEDFQYPQGVQLTNSNIVNWGNDVEVDNAISVNIGNDVIDEAGSSAIYIHAPLYLDVHDNYIHVQNGNWAINMQQPGGPVNGLWIQHNLISGASTNQAGVEFSAGPTTTATYASGSNTITVSSNTGIAVGEDITSSSPTAGLSGTVTALSGTTVTLSTPTTAAGTTVPVTFGNGWSGVHVDGNEIENLAVPIFLGQTITGDVDDNTGSGNSASFIDFGTNLSNLEISGNHSTDDYPILGATSGFPLANVTVGVNESPSGSTTAVFPEGITTPTINGAAPGSSSGTTTSGATFPSTGGVVCNISSTVSTNCDAAQLESVIGSDVYDAYGAAATAEAASARATATATATAEAKAEAAAEAYTAANYVPITATATGITTPSLALTSPTTGTTGNLLSYNFDSTGVAELTAEGSPALTTSSCYSSPDCVNFPSGSNYYKGTFSANSTTIYTRQYINVLTEGTTTNDFLQLWENGTEEFSLYLNENNILGWSNAIAGTSGAVSATPLSVGSYNYVELYWVANATTGSFVVRVNGTTVYTSAAQDTGSAGANTIYFGNISSASSGWNINMDNADVGNTGWLGAYTSGTTTEMLLSSNAPGIASGFGTEPAIMYANGPASFSLQVGTSPSTSGVLTLPTASNQWNCFCTDTTNPTSTFSCRQSGFSATGATLVGVNTSTGAAANFTANDVLALSCFAH